MEKRRKYISLISYAVWLVLFVVVLVYVAQVGTGLETVTREASAGSLGEAFAVFTKSVDKHLGSEVGILLLQILVVLVTARTVGWLFRRLGQPVVIGEICAGIMLGPSLLGRVAPEAFEWLFPASSLDSIQLLSNFGLVLFMFVVGMELRLSDITKRFVPSLTISHIGIFLPFALSLPLSLYIYQDYAHSDTSFLSFALFIGISMSITAFPVLARIIQEQGLQRKNLGKLALSTAAASDITAWLILAGIIAISQSGSMLSMVYNLAFLVLYLLIMFGVIRPLFAMAGKVYDNTEVISHALIGGIFILLIFSSWVTELLSMHALFGAFMLGLVMPEDVSFRKVLTDKVEDVSLMLFLPLFFAASGLQTELGLLEGTDTWVMLLVFVLIATIGKVVGTYLPARMAGLKVRESMLLGALMNTRGLMELVVLAIGLELGILSPKLYVVLMLMTVITTVMTMPMIQVMQRIFAYIDKKRKHKHQLVRQDYKALISFGRPATGVVLSRLSEAMLRRGEQRPRLSAIHITTDMDLTMVEAEKYYQDSFSPLLKEAEQRGYAIETEHVISEDVEQAILERLRRDQYNMLIIGAGLRLGNASTDCEASNRRRTLTSRVGDLSLSATEYLLSIHTLLRDKMSYLVKHSPCSVGILLNRGYDHPQNIVLRLSVESDLKLLSYARTLAENHQAQLNLLLPRSASIQADALTLQGKEKLLHEENTTSITPCDLLIMSYDEWLRHYDKDQALIQTIPSSLILNIRSLN